MHFASYLINRGGASLANGISTLVVGILLGFDPASSLCHKRVRRSSLQTKESSN